MPILEEKTRNAPELAVSREPKVAKNSNKDGASLGEQALNDGMLLIAVCWVVLFLLALSLRQHNI